MSPEFPIIMYQSQDGQTKIEVKLNDETVWLTQAQMVELFQSSKSNISEHLSNIFLEGELTEKATVRKFRTVQTEGDREVEREITHYNLDAVLAVGYRVKSARATQFRIWATQILKEYIVKGFSMNDELLKQSGGGLYWKELLQRIRDIRSSEKVFYRQILEVYATSLDYNPNTDESIQFFKMVQNKMHFAAHGHTAAEVVFDRADSTKPFMGLTNFTGKIQPIKADITNAKNYLEATELDILNRITTAYLEFAELQAMRQNVMTMKDWVQKLDEFIKLTGSELLTHAGSRSAKQAETKALNEYEKYKALLPDDLSPVEQHYLQTLKDTQKLLEKKPKPRKSKKGEASDE
jgi:hypothetical protein